MSEKSLKPLLGALCVLGVASGDLQAAGFSLFEQSASGMGNAFAGAAASAEDASTIWFNPAGLTQLPGHSVVVAGHAIKPSIKFSNTASTAPAVISNAGGNGGDAGDLAVVPNLYMSMSLSDQWKIGLGLNVPFGLMTEYDDSFVGRFQGLKSEITTININPTVAYKVSDRVSLGVGVSYQKAEAELTNRRVLGVNTEGVSRLVGDDTQVGFNLGALFTLGEDMRLGVSYRSSMNHELEGDARLTQLNGAVVSAGTFPISAGVELPAIASLSIVQRYSAEWDLLGDVTWTQWSSIQSIDIVNTNSGATVDALNLRLEDAWRLSLGINYRPNDQWVIKGGFAWDQSPVQDEHRTVRLPDTDRYWVTVGAKLKLSPTAAIDFGYAHIFGAGANINQNLGAASTRGTVVGDYDTAVDVLSVQASFAF